MDLRTKVSHVHGRDKEDYFRNLVSNGVEHRQGSKKGFNSRGDNPDRTTTRLYYVVGRRSGDSDISYEMFHACNGFLGIRESFLQIRLILMVDMSKLG